MKKIITVDLLDGEGLFYYYTTDCPDSDYTSIVKLLPYATMDIDKAYKILERCQKEGKKLIATYPGMDEIDVSKLEYIGSIMDGELYIG
jgi:hypothetical protein